MTSQLDGARASLREQLDWRGPNGRPQGILTLSREQAEAVLVGPTEPIAVLDEIGRLAERYADGGGMKKPTGYRRFVCQCGADWMTVIPGAETCQRCYLMSQPDITDWIKDYPNGLCAQRAANVHWPGPSSWDD